MNLKEARLGKLIEDIALVAADIGARGGVDEDMLPIAWATRVIGFEPEAEEAARLTAHGDARWKEVTVLPFAVGGHVGHATLHVPESKQGASLLPHDAHMVEQFGYGNLHIDRQELPVETVTLDSLHANGRLPRVDYLKIDIEGVELEVLQSAKSVLQDCAAIKVEGSFLRQRVGQALVWDVAAFLLQEGFAIVGIRDIHKWRRRNLPAHPYQIAFEMPYSRGQLAQCDLIALKSHEAITTTVQGLRVVLVAAVLGYFDYAVTLMRSRPEIAAHAQEAYGCDLERELKNWSAARGRTEVAKAIRASLRTLVPLGRSLAGKLPYAKPARPY